jgi:uncharacterized protein (DUF2252 family)
MNILDATTAYESWLRKQVDVVDADLREKHKKMAKSAFSFLRATFYHWVPTWHRVCPGLIAAPKVLAVGDLHVENFGTWRDAEGRLSWGVNDFDEAAVMPYTIDLVRVATSAIMARRERKLRSRPEEACAAILKGYTQQIKTSGHPFVLEEHHLPLRAAALSTERDPAKYWDKLNAFKTVKAPFGVRRLLKAQLPEGAEEVRMLHRRAGAGSLGRPRYMALAMLEGSYVAREAKAMVPSAYGWATGRVNKQLLCDKINQAAVRSHDPYMKLMGPWLIRRLGPRCSRIDLDLLPARTDEAYFLEAMGRETANVHLGSPKVVRDIQAHLAGQKKGWLLRGAGDMADAVLADWATWKEHGKA